MSIRFQAKHKSGYFVDGPLTPFTFPAGEAHIKGAESLVTADFDYFIADLRGHDPQDLMHLALWLETIDAASDAEGIIGYPKTTVLLPYLPAARADKGNPAGARVYAALLSALDPDQIITLDPHSPFMPGLLDNLTVFPFERIIRKEVQDADSDEKAQPYVGVIAPDKGAVDRATRAAHAMGVPVYRAEKTRDFESGKLDGFTLLDTLPEEGRLLVVDDICDGGGTFIGLADEIGIGKERLDLWVTHGVFSKGFFELTKRFGTIHTTNSYIQKGVTYFPVGAPGTHVIHPEIKIHDITPYLYGEINV